MLPHRSFSWSDIRFISETIFSHFSSISHYHNQIKKKVQQNVTFASVCFICYIFGSFFALLQLQLRDYDYLKVWRIFATYSTFYSQKVNFVNLVNDCKFNGHFEHVHFHIILLYTFLLKGAINIEKGKEGEGRINNSLKFWSGSCPGGHYVWDIYQNWERLEVSTV